MDLNPQDAVHPNLARMAAAYDAIIEQLERNQLTPTQANAKVAQLEARDDQGVRWSIDPASGQYVRKTAFGDMEFDTPPRWGVRTEDAFDYTANPLVENPNGRLQHVQLQEMMTPPAGLAGATQTTGPRRPSMEAGFLTRITELPTRVKVGAAVALVAILGFAFTTAGGSDEPPAPTPQSTSKAPAKTPTKAKPKPKPKTKTPPAKAPTKK